MAPRGAADHHIRTTARQPLGSHRLRPLSAERGKTWPSQFEELQATEETTQSTTTGRDEAGTRPHRYPHTSRVFRGQDRTMMLSQCHVYERHVLGPWRPSIMCSQSLSGV
jgi:hypothetical protein